MKYNGKTDAYIPAPAIFALLDENPPVESYRQEVVRLMNSGKTMDQVASELGQSRAAIEKLWQVS